MRIKIQIVAVLFASMVIASAVEVNPFQLSIVPESSAVNSSSISVAKDSKRAFFVVLTNTSDKPQSVFETWNSWGYQAISFVIIGPSGEATQALVKPQIFTMNGPSTFVIPPGGHQVFPVILDDKWDVKLDLGEPGRTKIKLTAVYEVHASKESGEKNVWTGRIVSEIIETEVNHW